MAVTNIAQVKKNHSTGPRTPEGKIRAAMNSVKWGLGAKGILMLGEDEAEFEHRANGIFESLAPENAAEAEVSSLIVDDLWRLGVRAPNIEKALFAAEGEKLLKAHGPSLPLAAIASAAEVLGKAIDNWERQPLPMERDEKLFRRAEDLEMAVIEVSAKAEWMPFEETAELHRLLAPLMNQNAMIVNAKIVKNTKKSVPEDLPNPAVPAGSCPPAADDGVSKMLSEISRRARLMMTRLLDAGKNIEDGQDEERKAIIPHSLPKAEDMKRLNLYTQRLELSLSRHLAALEQLRKMRPAQPLTTEAGDRSREFRMKLRIVT